MLKFYFLNSKKVIFFLSTSIKINPENWNKKTLLIKSQEPDFERKNKLIHNFILRANEVIDKYYFANKILTPDIFLNEFEQRNIQNFYEFAHKEIDKLTTINKETRTIYHAKINRIADFKPNLQFYQINEGFIYELRAYLLAKNHENTVKKNLQVFKEILRIAKNQNLIDRDPFNNFKIGTIKGNRQALTIEELKKIENYYANCTVFHEKNILRYFLAACYTSLRISDLQRLKKENFFNVEYESKHLTIIKIVQYKTDNPVTIPLIEKAKNILLNSNGKFEPFDKKTDQHINRILRDIGAYCKINKPLTMHIGRHTFATLQVNNGVPIEVISKLLGHTQIRTTETYAKINNSLIFNNLDTLNKL